MDGIIPVYKPSGCTSFDVVAAMRRICMTKSVGHGGTLDPMAEGVLPIFLGAATKAVDLMPDTSKEYLAGFRFGMTTDTQDITGTIIAMNPAYVSRNKMIFVERYKGEIEQIPPMFSAVSVGGKRLYELAREGIEVEREPRKVTIHSIKVEEYADNVGVMRVSCSKGTYIRTLIHDIGNSLGVGGVMTSLVRTKSAGFTPEQCQRVEELQRIALEHGLAEIEKRMTTLEQFFACYPKAFLTTQQTYFYDNGVALKSDEVEFERIYDGIYGIVNDKKIFTGLGFIAKDEARTFKVIKRFRTIN